MLLPFRSGLILTTHMDAECSQLADRHYTRRKKSIGKRQFAGNGEKIVLRDAEASVVFVWIRQNHRLDGQVGYNCAMFRNEGSRLSSEVILEAERFAVDRWGPGRAFTFIDPRKIRSTNPGCCFKKAGWFPAGISKKRRKPILEKFLVINA